YVVYALVKLTPFAGETARKYLIGRAVYTGLSIVFPFISTLPPIATAVFTGWAIFTALPSLVFIVVWYIYFKTSKRVRVTYGPPETGGAWLGWIDPPDWTVGSVAANPKHLVKTNQAERVVLHSPRILCPLSVPANWISLISNKVCALFIVSVRTSIFDFGRSTIWQWNASTCLPRRAASGVFASPLYS